MENFTHSTARNYNTVEVSEIFWCHFFFSLKRLTHTSPFFPTLLTHQTLGLSPKNLRFLDFSVVEVLGKQSIFSIPSYWFEIDILYHLRKYSYTLDN